MLAIDAELRKIGRKFEGDVRNDVIGRVINAKFSRGNTDQALEDGLEVMSTREGTDMRKFGLVFTLKVSLFADIIK